MIAFGGENVNHAEDEDDHGEIKVNFAVGHFG